MGRASTVVSRIASEDYLSSVLIVRTVDDPPFPVVQGEGAETRAHDDCAKKEGIQWGVDIVSFGLFKLTDFNFFSHPLYTLLSQNP